jgi:hypothetical protein
VAQRLSVGPSSNTRESDVVRRFDVDSTNHIPLVDFGAAAIASTTAVRGIAHAHSGCGAR